MSEEKEPRLWSFCPGEGTGPCKPRGHGIVETSSGPCEWWYCPTCTEAWIEHVEHREETLLDFADPLTWPEEPFQCEPPPQ